MSNEYHIPVLLHSVIEYLINREIDTHLIVDGTAGGGGYSEKILENISDDSVLICIDKDENALRFVENRLKDSKKKVIIEKENFANIRNVLNKYGYEKATGIVLDLGLSSYQLTNEDGFSFMRDTRLDMRADKDSSLDAEKVINEYGRRSLGEIFRNFGEIRNPARLAETIERERRTEKITTTGQLSDIIRKEYGLKGNYAFRLLSKVFQALRIEVNGELEDLKNILDESVSILKKGGRISVVSYHSLEDRIVKNFFRSASGRDEGSKRFKLLNKKVIVPGREEIKMNSKARSAKLRTAELIHED